jgi:hypothetical protein
MLYISVQNGCQVPIPQKAHFESCRVDAEVIHHDLGSRRKAEIVSITSHNASHYQFPSSNALGGLPPDDCRPQILRWAYLGPSLFLSVCR